MTAFVLKDNKITPEGLKDYKISPPLGMPFVGPEF